MRRQLIRATRLPDLIYRVVEKRYIASFAAMAPFGSLLSELGFENVDAFTVPFADVKKKYFQWLRQNHPDKQANSCKPQVDPERVRAVLAAWDDFRDFRQGDQSSAASSRREEPRAAGEEDPWGYRQTGRFPSAKPASKSASSTSAPKAAPHPPVDVGPCFHAPHCKKFFKKHGQKTAKKMREYLFLYAAEDRCLTCLRFFADSPDFDVGCTSCGKGAEEWALDGANGFPLDDDLVDFFGKLKL